MDNPRISVIVCCFNSARRITDTLIFLSKQDLADYRWEVIIVDNNSSDGTAQLANETWKSLRSDVSFKVVPEVKQGLSAARICGYQNAKHEILCFCDDDNWLSSDYLSKISEIFASYPEVGIVGGMGIPIFEVRQPDWFSDYQHFFACGGQFRYNGKITAEKGWLYGAGLSIRREAFTFDPSKLLMSDRSGNKLSSGGDTEICLRAVANGWQIWYDSSLTFRHFMPEERCHLNYLKNLILAG